MPDHNFLVDPILPVHEIHLLGGPSGAGKTRWLLNTILDWEKGWDFLSYKSHPVPWVYVAADRSMASVSRTLCGMGILPSRINCIPAWDKGMSENEIMDEIQRSKAHLAVWESFGSFVDPPGQGKQVKAYLNRIAKFCRNYDKTIFGVVESPKQKPYERYDNPRQRVSGAAAWAHFSETIFLVEPLGFDQAHNAYRDLTICPRNSAAQQIKLAFNSDGKLVPADEKELIDLGIFKKAVTH